jgi:RND family efflux transporter MFP subunit
MILRKLGISAALCLAFLAARPNHADAATLVAVDPVRVESVNETISVVGRFLSVEKGIVATQTEGAVAEIFADVGTRVEAGQPLAQLDVERLTLRRDQWKAQLEVARALQNQARASLALEQQTLDRIGELEESAAFSQARQDDQMQQVARMNALLASAGAGVDQAQANLDLAEADLAGATIRAPYDGVIVLRHTEVGSYLDGGDSVVTMVNDTAIEIEADVPSSSISGLRPGVAVQLTLDNGTHRQATVRAIGVAEDALTRTRPVRFLPDWQPVPGEIADGQSVLVELPVAAIEQALTVSKDAVLRDGGRASVFVVIDGVAHSRDVLLGAAVGARFIVIEGLAEGDVVVVRGNEALADDTAVTF